MKISSCGSALLGDDNEGTGMSEISMKDFWALRYASLLSVKQTYMIKVSPGNVILDNIAHFEICTKVLNGSSDDSTAGGLLII